MLFRPPVLRFLILSCAASTFLTCGIDDYIFLSPVTETDWHSSDQKIVFKIPTSQTDDYFERYVIYYRLYPSSVSFEGRSFSDGDFSSINTSLHSHYRRIYPYTTADDDAPVYLQSLFENTLGFKELSFAAAVNSKSDLNDEKKMIVYETPLTDEAKGKSVSIDFNLSDLGTAHPCLIIDDTKYRILRIEAIDTVPSRDFLGYAAMSGQDYEATAQTYTYAMFYIVARGVDETFTTILSRATFLGVLQLPAEPTV